MEVIQVCKTCGNRFHVDSDKRNDPCFICKKNDWDCVIEFYGSCHNDLTDHYTVEEAAEEFGLEPFNVLEACKKGLIDSFPVYAPNHAPLRLIYDADMDRFLRDGPNRLFTFDEAIEQARKSHALRRPCWHAETCVWWPDSQEFEPTGFGHLHGCVEGVILIVDGQGEHGYSYEPFYPKQTDRDAADWYVRKYGYGSWGSSTEPNGTPSG